MTIKLKGSTGLTLDGGDMIDVLTDYLCNSSYGAFAELQVMSVTQRDDGDFELSLAPKPVEAA